MAKLIDPDSLTQGVEVIINTGAKTIQLLVAGNLNNASPGSTSGVTLQAIYSFLKEEWKSDGALNKFKFPLKMFTKTDGIFINGWVFADATSRNLVRDGGWTEGANQYAGIISLGSFDATSDQAYYQNVVGYDANVKTTNFNKTGNLNEAIAITGFTGYLKSFLRIVGKIYSEYNLLSEQGITALEPVLYRLPLSNTPDLKINYSDVGLETSASYLGMRINYLKGVGFNTYSSSTAYPSSSVVYDDQVAPGRWFFAVNGGTSSLASTRATDAGVSGGWAPYDGERQIGSSYYAFNRLISGSNGTDQQIYNWVEYKLRTPGNINTTGSATANQRNTNIISGSVAELLLEYVGDTLKTKPGVYIYDFNPASTNNIKFRDITVNGGGVSSLTGIPVTTTERSFPFVAGGNINFSANLVAEPDVDTKYAMYFDSTPTGGFDSANAVLVKNNAGVGISGSINASSIPFDFDYDFNTQGGRTAGTDAAVSIVAQGLNGATWVLTTYTITRAAGQSVTVNADDERNYANAV